MCKGHPSKLKKKFFYKTVQLISDPIEGGGDPAGIHNENYDDSLASSTGSNSAAERSDSGLDHSADELDRRQNFSLDDDDEDDLADEGVFHEDPLVMGIEIIVTHRRRMQQDKSI